MNGVQRRNLSELSEEDLNALTYDDLFQTALALVRHTKVLERDVDGYRNDSQRLRTERNELREEISDIKGSMEVIEADRERLLNELNEANNKLTDIRREQKSQARARHIHRELREALITSSSTPNKSPIPHRSISHDKSKGASQENLVIAHAKKRIVCSPISSSSTSSSEHNQNAPGNKRRKMPTWDEKHLYSRDTHSHTAVSSLHVEAAAPPPLPFPIPPPVDIGLAPPMPPVPPSFHQSASSSRSSYNTPGKPQTPKEPYPREDITYGVSLTHQHADHRNPAPAPGTVRQQLDPSIMPPFNEGPSYGGYGYNAGSASRANDGRPFHHPQPHDSLQATPKNPWHRTDTQVYDNRQMFNSGYNSTPGPSYGGGPVSSTRPRSGHSGYHDQSNTPHQFHLKGPPLICGRVGGSRCLPRNDALRRADQLRSLTLLSNLDTEKLKSSTKFNKCFCKPCNLSNLDTAAEVVAHAFNPTHLDKMYMNGHGVAETDFEYWEQILAQCQIGGLGSMPVSGLPPSQAPQPMGMGHTSMSCPMPPTVNNVVSSIPPPSFAPPQRGNRVDLSC